MLLGHQWKEGSIPADTILQAPIAKLSATKTRVLMRALGDRFTPHPSIPDALANEFMERVREEQRLKFERQKTKGKNGAAKRWGDSTSTSTSIGKSVPTHSTSISTGTEKHTESDSTSNASANADIEIRDHLASLGEVEVARRRASESLAAARAFCAEALEAAVEAGFVGDSIERQTWVEANAEAAMRLLREHGVELTMRRWQAVLDDLKVGHLRNRDDVSLRFLLRLWPQIDARERRPTATSKPAAEISEHTRSYYDRIEERTGGAA